jgi:hypothetical protein
MLVLPLTYRQNDPELAGVIADMQTKGPAALGQYWNDPNILKKFSTLGETLNQRLAQMSLQPRPAGADGPASSAAGTAPAPAADADGAKASEDAHGAPGAAPDEHEEEEGMFLQDAVQARTLWVNAASVGHTHCTWVPPC